MQSTADNAVTVLPVPTRLSPRVSEFESFNHLHDTAKCSFALQCDCSCLRVYSENDKDCVVCHSKNQKLSDALQAQSESRARHETFHNELNRSAEPFSVVAEYFTRGMFNKIVLVNEPDDVNQDVSDFFAIPIFFYIYLF